jgi:hypothetical protein
MLGKGDAAGTLRARPFDVSKDFKVDDTFDGASSLPLLMPSMSIAIAHIIGLCAEKILSTFFSFSTLSVFSHA